MMPKFLKAIFALILAAGSTSVKGDTDNFNSLHFYSKHVTENKREIRAVLGGFSMMETEIYSTEKDTTLQKLDLTDGKITVRLWSSRKDGVVSTKCRQNADNVTEFIKKLTLHSEAFATQSNSLKSLKKKPGLVELTALSSVEELSPDKQAIFENKDLANYCKNHEASDEPAGGRHKRAVYFSDAIFPGTKWCGQGNISDSFEDLGEARETDKCCRTHDHCPYTISGFQSNWGLFNYRPSTLSHCVCDELLYNCLRAVHNNDADVVGDLYFNVMKMPCFEFETVQVCAKRAWWGRCEEYKNDRKAVRRDPLVYS